MRSERPVAGWLMDRVEPFQVFSAGLPAFPMRAIHATRLAPAG